MKTKTFEIEVITTKRVRVILPEWYAKTEAQKDWESGLWRLEGDTPEEKIVDIASYAASMAANHPGGYGHDGVGKMIESPFEKPDYEKNQYQVVAIVTDEDVECEVQSQAAWVSVGL
ncbi:hypothetical protein [Alcaligenes endophyticus]|uniref:Uncharacterized protein n=1 Tax=Alcaligenes endophyticus TaxID=1929088 RepID=A0ABT8EIT6_9BURK|nr:hypothetical protein [Alcaligenes endophyticus]MCX5592486.1 hypothetical protein [Alcaligenes endophyticus]MDN4121211.1 hypothetical protein [Alcaligenes endophyticus]